jgi:hypothetical protein
MGGAKRPVRSERKSDARIKRRDGAGLISFMILRPKMRAQGRRRKPPPALRLDHTLSAFKSAASYR